MNDLLLADVLGLSVPERIELIADIWDTIAASSEPVGLSQQQRDELDRRLDDYRRRPDLGKSWEEVKQRILGER